MSRSMTVIMPRPMLKRSICWLPWRTVRMAPVKSTVTPPIIVMKMAMATSSSTSVKPCCRVRAVMVVLNGG